MEKIEDTMKIVINGVKQDVVPGSFSLEINGVKFAPESPDEMVLKMDENSVPTSGIEINPEQIKALRDGIKRFGEQYKRVVKTLFSLLSDKNES